MSTNHLESWVLVTSVASCLGLNATPAFAVEPHAELKLVQVGEVQYMSGGINKKEREALQTRAASFRVFVSFVGKHEKAQVRRVLVTLIKRDEGNSVVRLKTAGPLLLLSLPPGNYTLQAMLPGSEPVQSPLDLLPGKNEQLQVVLDTSPVPTPLAADAVASTSSHVF